MGNSIFQNIKTQELPLLTRLNLLDLKKEMLKDILSPALDIIIQIFRLKKMEDILFHPFMIVNVEVFLMLQEKI